ncbi:MAG: hypothetical protein DLM61_21875 [Pseudonocardiales bacterium]|nr:MAG: hypothetical protein DLM61_21875 [Pseudonocardiales bacterium]
MRGQGLHLSLRRVARRTRAAPVALAAATLVAGCGGGQTKTERLTVSQSTPAATGTSSTSQTEQAPPAVKSVQYTIPSAGGNAQSTYKVDVYGLRRRGPFVTLEAGIACVKATGGAADCSTELDFATPQQTRDFNTTGGVILIDPSEKKEYLVVRDSQERPYTSQLSASTKPGPTVYRVFVNFPAPPASTTSMDVMLPGSAPEIHGVPVS